MISTGGEAILTVRHHSSICASHNAAHLAPPPPDAICCAIQMTETFWI